MFTGVVGGGNVNEELVMLLGVLDFIIFSGISRLGAPTVSVPDVTLCVVGGGPPVFPVKNRPNGSAGGGGLSSKAGFCGSVCGAPAVVYG